jgi:DNA polymerase III epsilon subunit-like protein
MKKVVVFDTETTGLPKARRNAVSEQYNWPDLVSLSYVVYIVSSTSKTLVKKVDRIILPEGWVIPEESVAFHKITQSIAETQGIHLQTVLEEFAHDIKDAYMIIAHNLYFDKNIIYNAMYWRRRMNPYSMWPQNAIEFCSYEKYRKELGKEKKRKDLNSLYSETFGTEAPQNAHNSMRDVEVLDSIFWKRWGLEINTMAEKIDS